MKLGREITIEQVQKFAMSPAIIQAIQILQLTSQELQELIEKEMLENPVLEIEDYVKSNNYAPSNSNAFAFESFVSNEETLEEYLLIQLELTDLKGKNMEIGKYIISAIDENGYLSIDIDEIAEKTNSSYDEVKKILSVIQTFEPLGVGAIDLKDCLLIQLREKGLLDNTAEYIVQNCLEDLADNRISVIAKELNISEEKVELYADVIRGLEPKPGRGYETREVVKYVIPDVILEKDEEGLKLYLNDNSAPHLSLNGYYSELLLNEKDEEVKKYLSEKINSAEWLIKSVNKRNETIYNVAREILKSQSGFFERGPKRLKPLTRKVVAQNLGLNESTVSRAVSGKYIETPKGVFELRYFFSSSLKSKEEGSISSSSIKELIKEMISLEDIKNPLSDQDITDNFKEKGISISRRTVAKYRESMNIKSSVKRRRY